jgi:transportin-1
MCSDANNVSNYKFIYISLQGDVEDDDTIPDKESDIKPRFHKSKTHTLAKSQSQEAGADSDDDMDDDDDTLSDWNLSK